MMNKDSFNNLYKDGYTKSSVPFNDRVSFPIADMDKVAKAALEADAYYSGYSFEETFQMAMEEYLGQQASRHVMAELYTRPIKDVINKALWYFIDNNISERNLAEALKDKGISREPK